MSKNSGYMENPFRQNFFRAGHAHAGAIVILSIICEVLADSATFPVAFLWFVRIGIPLAAALIFGGLLLFGASPGRNSSQRSGLPDLCWSSGSCGSSHFARHWLGQSRIDRKSVGVGASG